MAIALLPSLPLAFQIQAHAQSSTLDVSIVTDASNKGDGAFSPNPVIVSQGNILRWTNDDNEPHSVTMGNATFGHVSGGFDSDTIAPGDSYSFAFFSPGEYEYYDKLNPSANGKVIVTESASTIKYLYAYTNRQAYNFGDTVAVRGNLPDPNTSNPVSLTMIDEQGRTISFRQSTVNQAGSFSYDFEIPTSGITAGMWTIRVAYEGLNSTISFRVNSLELPISINSSNLVDLQGRFITDLDVGHQAILQFSVANTASSSRDMVLIMQVVNQDGFTESLTWLSTGLAAQQSIDAGIGWVPSSQGSFTVKAFVWDNLRAPTLLSNISTSTIEVG
jgi:plastocyanin